MTSLDSRMLTYLDTFGCTFDEPGEARYRLASAALACPPADEDEDLSFSIVVREGKGGAQHDVAVHRQGREFVAQPAELTIEAGDLVMWHSAETTPPYAVQGVSGSRDRFDSTAMTSRMLYTHPFGLPGEYEWVDALRGSVMGVVRVGTLDRSHENGCREWREALASGTVVVIDGDR